MSGAKHTPGPWTDGREGSGDFISPAVVVLGDTGACSRCGGGPGEIFIKPADKKLIKAAPELADALEAVRASAQCGCTLREIDSGHRTDCRLPHWLDVAAEALRKAGRLP